MVFRVQFDVGGHVFKISERALENGPISNLTRLYKSGNNTNDSGTIEVDRPVDLFGSVLALYQTGELHFPANSCPQAFLNELEFWDIDPELTESCCFNRLQSFLDEQNTLRKFQEKRENNIENNGEFRNKIMRKIWDTVDYRKTSIYARSYFILSLFMVLLSIVTLALSTDPYFRRSMTNCERLEYMEYSGMEKVQLAKKWLQRSCDNETMPQHNHPDGTSRFGTDGNKTDCSSMAESLYRRVYLRPFISEDQRRPRPSNETQGVLNPNSSIEEITKASQTPESDGEYVELPDFKVPIQIFVVLEVVTLVYFTIDIVLRLLSCPSRKYYFYSPINLSDALALTCTYIHVILMYFLRHEKYRDNWMDILKFTQVLRSFRFFRIMTNVRAGQILAYTVRSNLSDLSVILLFLLAGMSIFSSCLFFMEEREDIRSIPEGWYWAIVTMTTVGYGDIAPRTAIGRVLACVCALAGIVMLAITVPIFANNFLVLYQFANSVKAVKKFQNQKLTKQNPDLMSPPSIKCSNKL